MSRKIQEIRAEFEQASYADYEALFRLYGDDTRVGVQSLIKKYKRRTEEYLEELSRTEHMKYYEHKYEEHGLICGVDEVGRGPLAGPVVAGAVILPRDCNILYLDDSTKLTAKKREELDLVIRENCVSFALGQVEAEQIDQWNILQATYEAMRRALNGLNVKADLVLVDAVTIPDLMIPQVPLVKGDARSVSITAASIIAKVARDALMDEYDSIYPEYGFASHKGYGTQAHIEAIRKYGPCPIHRRSFIRKFTGEGEMLE